MSKKLFGASFGLACGLALALHVAPAKAADTNVTCYSPSGSINTGQDGSAPRFTIQCLGGSSAGNITYFAYRFSTNNNLTALLERVFSSFVFENTPSAALSLSSNLSDTSGNAWGCGAANCRIIDYLVGY